MRVIADVRKHVLTYAISPRFRLEDLEGATFEKLVEIFKDQMMGWLIEPANHLKSQQHAGFAILAIVLSYFEPIGQFLEGKRGDSQKQFALGLRAVFPDLDKAEFDALVGELYQQLRCGMFHRGITREKVVISPASDHAFAIEMNDKASLGRIVVTPVNLMQHLEQHLNRYVAQLLDPANVELRANFLKWFANRAS